MAQGRVPGLIAEGPGIDDDRLRMSVLRRIAGGAPVGHCGVWERPVLYLGVKVGVVHAGSATVLSGQTGDAGLDLEHPPLRVVQLGPGGGDSADDPTCAGCAGCVHGVFLSSLFLAKVLPHTRAELP